VSIIMPAYNLEHIIDAAVNEVIRELERNNIKKYEVIVVDDGSTDKTYQKVRINIQNPKVKIYKLTRNMGKGFALIYGFKHSRGDVIVFFDADLDIPPKQIIPLIKTVTKCYDVAITIKHHPQAKINGSLQRKLLSIVFNSLARLLTGVKFRDTQTGAKAFKREVLEYAIPKLAVKRYAFDLELLLVIVKRGYRVIEIPALYSVRHNKPVRLSELQRLILDLLGITYRLKVKKQYEPY